MKTIIIFDQCGQEDIKFFVIDGDYRHLDRIYVNSYINEEKTNELCDLIFDEGSGEIKLESFPNFPVNALFNDHSGVFVIVAGFLP